MFDEVTKDESVGEETESIASGIEGCFAELGADLAGFEPDEELGEDADDESSDVAGNEEEEESGPLPIDHAQESRLKPDSAEVLVCPSGINRFIRSNIFELTEDRLVFDKLPGYRDGFDSLSREAPSSVGVFADDDW